MPSLATLFVVVFVLNLIPAFAPPTWIAMSLVGLTYPQLDALFHHRLRACEKFPILFVT